MSLKIIGGMFRNRLLKAPKGSNTRPTTSIARKTVFDIAQFNVQGARFLDVFAGSGLMGLEALSRGASCSTFIDKDRTAVQCILQNIKILGVEEHCVVLQGEALQILKKLAKTDPPFDLVYVDPPYGQNIILGRERRSACETILYCLDHLGLVAQGGILFIEEAFPPSIKPELPLDTLVHKDTRKIGKSILHQYICLAK